MNTCLHVYNSNKTKSICKLSMVLHLQTYLNGDVLTLVRALITGTETTDFERILMEGLGIVRRNTMADITNARKRSHLGQLSLAYGPLEKLDVS